MSEINNIHTSLEDLSFEEPSSSFYSEQKKVIKQTSENNTTLVTNISLEKLKFEDNEGKNNTDSLFGDTFSEFENKSADELYSIIMDKKIWLDINSPKEWDKWIEKNKDTLPANFKENFAKKFPDLYADVDASIIGFPNSIDKNIKKRANEINKQNNGPYIIDINELSKDIPFDLPITEVGREELMATLNAKMQKGDGILKFKNKKEALKNLAEFQEAIKEASETIDDLMFAYIDSVKETLKELGIAWEEGFLETIGVIIKEILPTWISISILNSLLRVGNRNLIRIFAGAKIVEKIPIIKHINKILLGKYNPYEPGQDVASTDKEATRLLNEIRNRDLRMKQAKYLYQGNNKKLKEIEGNDSKKIKIIFGKWLELGIPFTSNKGIFSKYGHIDENLIEQTFYRKLGNIINNQGKFGKLVDTLFKPILGVENYKDSVVKPKLENGITNKNKFLDDLFEDIEKIEKDGFKIFNLQEAKIRENSVLGKIEKGLILSHDISDLEEQEIQKIFDKYVKKLKKGYVPLDNIYFETNDKNEAKNKENFSKIEQDLKKELFSELNKLEGVKITDDFLEKTKDLKNANKYFLEDYSLKSEEIETSFKELIGEERVDSLDPEIKRNLKSFLKEVKNGNKNYNTHTFADIISRIISGDEYEKAIYDSFKIKTELIESIEIKGTLEHTIHSLSPLDVTNPANLKPGVETTKSKKGFIKKYWGKIKDFKLFKGKTPDEVVEIIENDNSILTNTEIKLELDSFNAEINNAKNIYELRQILNKIKSYENENNIDLKNDFPEQYKIIENSLNKIERKINGHIDGKPFFDIPYTERLEKFDYKINRSKTNNLDLYLTDDGYLGFYDNPERSHLMTFILTDPNARIDEDGTPFNNYNKNIKDIKDKIKNFREKGIIYVGYDGIHDKGIKVSDENKIIIEKEIEKFEKKLVNLELKLKNDNIGKTVLPKSEKKNIKSPTIETEGSLKQQRKFIDKMYERASIEAELNEVTLDRKDKLNEIYNQLKSSNDIIQKSVIEDHFKNSLGIRNDIRGISDLKKLKKTAQTRNIILDVKEHLKEVLDYSDDEIKSILGDYFDVENKLKEFTKGNINTIFNNIKEDIKIKFNDYTEEKLTTEIATNLLDNIKNRGFRIVR